MTDCGTDTNPRWATRRSVLGIGVVSTVALLASCSAPTFYQQWGSTREVLRDGNTQARVTLNDVDVSSTSYGVGALARLEGEITIDAGQVWVSRSSGPDSVTTTAGLSENDAASMLFVGTVAAWTDVEITELVAPLEFGNVLGAAFADTSGTSGPRPFRIVGDFADVKLHVIGGQCPIRARMHGEPMTKPAFELSLPRVSGTVVGIYAKDAAGEITHMGSDTHTHIIFEHDGQMITGHIESIGVLPGSTLQVPSVTR